MELKIDKEFKDLVPPQSKEEHDGLELSIFTNGFDSAYPIIVWDGAIVDGHNRYNICQKLGIDYQVTEKNFNSRSDAINWIIDNQLNRRNITADQRTYLIGKRYKEEKKEHGGDRKSIAQNELLIPTAEKIAEQHNVSRETVKRAEKFADAIDKVAESSGINPHDLLNGNVGKITKQEIIEVSKELPETQSLIMEKLKDTGNIKEAKKEAKKEEEVKKFEQEIIDEIAPVQEKKIYTFNKTNDKIEWAKYSWNPVTGCKFGCPYCYAKDIANRFYENGFEPTFHEEKLDAPVNTKVPAEAATDIGYKNCFVCSMADLFGSWIPDEWIEKVLKAVRENPQWNFLFLTKNPKRLVNIDFPDNVWIGTTVDVQSRVEPAKQAFRQIKATVKFLSCEPLQEHLVFDDMSMFDWLIIGGRSQSSGMPAGQPEWKWVEDLLIQARKNDVSVYFKPNLEVRPNEYPHQEV